MSDENNYEIKETSDENIGKSGWYTIASREIMYGELSYEGVVDASECGPYVPFMRSGK